MTTPSSNLNPTVADLIPAKSNRRETVFVIFVIAITVALSVLPSIIGFAISRPNLHYVGSVYDIDDNLVYYSWIRQAADGHFFLRNLFTTDTQIPIQFNLLISLIGLIVRCTGLSIPVVFFAVKLIASISLLTVIYRLFCYLIPVDSVARISGFVMACLGSGLGWMYWPGWADKNGMPAAPVDTWQPEAFTFQSIETSMLFAASQVLIVGAVFLLVVGQRTGKIRYAVWAGILALLLGNIHSYDILHLGFAWFAYLIVSGCLDRRFDKASWIQAAISGAIALPSPLYQLHMFQVDPVWHARVLHATLSPHLIDYLDGWGLVFAFAIVCLIFFVIAKFQAPSWLTNDRRSLILPICWFAAALVASYLPHVAFQRKMIMGADIPLSLLAGCGLSWLTNNLGKALRYSIVALCTLLTIPTSLLFVYRDVNHVFKNKSEMQTLPFLTDDQVSTLAWIRQNSSPDSAFIGPQTLMTFIPGYCDRYVYVGHWGETPNYDQRILQTKTLLLDDESDGQRISDMASWKVQYIVSDNNLVRNGKVLVGGKIVHYLNFALTPDQYRISYSNPSFTVYELSSLKTRLK